MSDTPMRRRAEAALRLPPLASGRRDPILEPRHTCHICSHRGKGLVYLFGQWMCRDRVECYQRFKAAR